MMITRSYLSGPLEIREDGRTITGLAAPYQTPVTIHEAGRSYTESLARGAFADDTANPAAIPLMARHPKSDDTLPIGVTLTLREDSAGLRGEWKVSKTELGDEVLELIRDGAVSGLSIGFISDQDRWSADKRTVQRVRAHLDHVAIVRTPAYPTARIVGLRAAHNLSTPLLRVARLRH